MEEQATDSARQEELADIEKNKAMGILAYILFIIPLLAAKDSKFAMYHANQGLVLFISAVAAQIFAHMIPFIGWMIAPMLSLGVLVLMVVGIVSASKGEMKPLPLIGGLNILK